jgi:hypothetical protein
MQGNPISVALPIEARYSGHLINTSTAILQPKLISRPALEIWHAT